jgi:hypothetical protein
VGWSAHGGVECAADRRADVAARVAVSEARTLAFTGRSGAKLSTGTWRGTQVFGMHSECCATAIPRLGEPIDNASRAVPAARTIDMTTNWNRAALDGVAQQLNGLECAPNATTGITWRHARFHRKPRQAEQQTAVPFLSGIRCQRISHHG